MGEITSKSILQIENKLSFAEGILPLSDYDCNSICKELLYYQEDGSISWEDLNFFIQDIYQDEICLNFDFFELFSNNDLTYNFKSLSVLSILLSTGDALDKSVFLFKLFIKDERDYLTTANIYEMLSMMIEISIEKVPSLFKNMDPEMQMYLDTLKEKIPEFISYIGDKFEKNDKGQILLEKFVPTMSSYKQLFSTKGIRHILWEFKK